MYANTENVEYALFSMLLNNRYYFIEKEKKEDYVL